MSKMILDFEKECNVFFSYFRIQQNMDHQSGDLSFCQTHKAMLNCLETVVNDVHVNLTSIDTEVNKCLPPNHQLPANMWTPHFFKEPASNSPVWTGILPVIAELTKAHLNAKPDDPSCTRSCVPELPSILLTLEREIDRHVQYVNYLQEKMNALPTKTNLSVSMVTSKSRLMRASSISRNKIRTNPSLPVLHRSPKVLNLSQDSNYIASVSQQMNCSTDSIESTQSASAFQNSRPCFCCNNCVEALQWFSNSVCNKIQYLKDQCRNLQIRLITELKEKEKELMVQLAQQRKAKQTVTNNFSRLEGLGLQGLTICSNIHIFAPDTSNQSSSNQTTTRYAADGQSCNEDNTNCVYQTTTTTQSMSTTSEGSYSLPTTTTQSMSTTSEESYSLPINISSDMNVPSPPAVSLCSDVTQFQDNVYEEPVFLTVPAIISPQSSNTSLNNNTPDSPMPELLEFQRKRSNSMKQSGFNRDMMRRRSNTISGPVSATTREKMNASGPYSTIHETADELLHIKADIAVTFPEAKPRKMKKSKSSIIVRATKLKNFITKKFKRKSWGGSATRKSMSPTSNQASSVGVQFFEYDLSDDGEDNGSVSATSNTLGDLSLLTGNVDTLASSFAHQTRSAEMTFNGSRSTTHDSWLSSQIATIERHLNNSPIVCEEEEFTSSVTTNSSNNKPAKSVTNPPAKSTTKRTKPPASYNHTQIVMPSRPPVMVDREDLFQGTAPLDLSTISSIQPVRSSTVNTNFSSKAPTVASTDTSISSDQLSTCNQPGYITNHDGSSRKRLFDSSGTSQMLDSIYSFHDDSSFDIHQGYGSYRKMQKMASTPCHPSVLPAWPLVSHPNSSKVIIPHQESELLKHLCQIHPSQTSRYNMEKLCQIKPYLIKGYISTAALLYLIKNYPHNYKELQGYNHVTKKISKDLVSFVFAPINKPHIFARDLVWHLFTLSQLYGGKTGTESLDPDIIMAIRDVTLDKYNISNYTWQYKCVTFIHRSINYLFKRRLRAPVFRSLL